MAIRERCLAEAETFGHPAEKLRNHFLEPPEIGCVRQYDGMRRNRHGIMTGGSGRGRSLLGDFRAVHLIENSRRIQRFLSRLKGISTVRRYRLRQWEASLRVDGTSSDRAVGKLIGLDLTPDGSLICRKCLGTIHVSAT